MYRLILDDSYRQKPIAVANSKEALLDAVVLLLDDRHLLKDLPSKQLTIWQENEARTVVDYGSWTHFFYIDEEKGESNV